MRERATPGISWRMAAIAAGAAMAAFALFADRFGLGKPGFGERQALLFVAGVALALAGWSLGGGVARADSGGRASASGGALAGIRRAYLAAAVLLLNTLLLLAALDGALWLGFAISDRAGWTAPEPESEGLVGALALLRLARLASFRVHPEPNSPLRLDDADLARIYPGWSRGEVRRLIEESRLRKLEYQPFSQFGEARYAGRHVNVTEHGFRRSSAQGPWPMASSKLNVWVFGGSTTFGYGLPDDETLPSSLQRSLSRELPEAAVAVYNFGQGYYYSSQELALFYRLLVSSETLPAVAVFIDGVNESMREPFYSEALRTLVRAPYLAPYARVRPSPLEGGEQVVARYLENQRLITAWCDAHGIRPLFVWQPSPAWKYDLRYHLFPSADFSGEIQGDALLGQSPHYAALERHLEQRPVETDDLARSPSFLSLADLQVGRQEPLYVDHVHYTAAFSREIAERIAARLAEILGAKPQYPSLNRPRDAQGAVSRLRNVQKSPKSGSWTAQSDRESVPVEPGGAADAAVLRSSMDVFSANPACIPLLRPGDDEVVTSQESSQHFRDFRWDGAEPAEARSVEQSVSQLAKLVVSDQSPGETGRLPAQGLRSRVRLSRAADPDRFRAVMR